MMRFMQNKKRYSIDGFISSGRLSNSNTRPAAMPKSGAKINKPQKALTGVQAKQRPEGLQPKADSQPEAQPKNQSIPLKKITLDSKDDERSKPRLARQKAPRSLKRRIIRGVIVVVLLVVVGGGGYLFYKANHTMGDVLSGNLMGLLSAEPLKKDANGRTNVLIFGTSEDRPESGNNGESLTDSIMVLSFKEEDEDLAMVSLPRDLWVKLDNPCTVGYQERINTVYMCGSNNNQDELAGAEALRSKVAEITGLTIQYHIHLNFAAVIGLVDAVGGVDVEVQGRGPVPYGVKPGSILDRNMDWMCNYQCHLVKYEPGVHHMDGEHALAFMRARNSSGGYGLPRSNFDRELNQQKVLAALVNKIMNSSTFLNYNKIIKILETVGDNLRTNINTKEVRSFVDVAKAAKQGEIRSLELVGGEEGNLVRNGSISGRSVVVPTAGTFDYGQIQAFLQKQLANPALAREAAKVGVYNATQTPGLAQKIADQLGEAGLEISQVDNAPAISEQEATVVVYQIGDGKPKSLAKIKQLLSAKQIEGIPNFNYDRTLDLVVVVVRDEQN